jgi:hypothetical protein
MADPLLTLDAMLAHTNKSLARTDKTECRSACEMASSSPSPARQCADRPGSHCNLLAIGTPKMVEDGVRVQTRPFFTFRGLPSLCPSES